MSVSDDGDRPAVEVLEDEGDGEPTEEEIREYAEFLGIDPEAEPALLWIAREGVVAPVPPPWKACQEGDEVFYFNFETQASIWDHPMDAHFRELVEKERRKTRGPTSPTADKEDDDNDKSFVSEAVESDIESSVASPSTSPAGAASTNAAAKPNASGASVLDASGADAADASFVSDAVDESISSAEGESERGAASAAGPSKSFISDVVTSEAEVSSLPAQDNSSFISREAEPETTSPTTAAVGKLSSKEQAALWNSKSGGVDTPRSADSSKSSGSHPGSARSSPRSADDNESPVVAAVTAPADTAAANSTARGQGSDARLKADLGMDSDDDARSVEEASPKSSSPAAQSSSAGAAPSPTPARATGSADTAAAASTAKSSTAKPSLAVGIGGAVPPRSPTISPTAADHVPLTTSPTMSANSSPMGGSLNSGSARSPNASGGPDAGKHLRSDSPGGGLPQGSPKSSPHSNSRPRPVLDHSGGVYSARSSNPSEVSEDFRSDWGIVTPPISARSATGQTAGGVEGHSLEVSATIDTRSMDTDFNRSFGLMSDRKGSADSKGMEKAIQVVPKSWQELRLDLEVLAEALQGIQLIRLNQQDYLKCLKLDT